MVSDGSGGGTYGSSLTHIKPSLASWNTVATKKTLLSWMGFLRNFKALRLRILKILVWAKKVILCQFKPSHRLPKGVKCCRKNYHTTVANADPMQVDKLVSHLRNLSISCLFSNHEPEKDGFSGRVWISNSVRCLRCEKLVWKIEQKRNERLTFCCQKKRLQELQVETWAYVKPSLQGYLHWKYRGIMRGRPFISHKP